MSGSRAPAQSGPADAAGPGCLLKVATATRAPAFALINRTARASAEPVAPGRLEIAFLAGTGFNAVMEAFFSTVKHEVAEWYESHGGAKADLFDYIEVFYNQRRRHSSANRMSAAAFERKMTHAA